MFFHFNARFVARQAMIAAIYALMTYSGAAFGYGMIQFRYSELLNWCAFYDPKNVVGLSLGCFLANLTSKYGMLDLFVGTLGTLLATVCMARSKKKWIAALWPAIFSFLYSGEALLVGEIPFMLFPAVTAQIMLSELIIVGVIGLPLISALETNKSFLNIVADPLMLPTKKSMF